MATRVFVDDLAERRAAVQADFGKHVDVLGRQALTVGATVALLAAAFAFALALLRLGLAWTIARRWEVRVARALTEQLDQLLDLGLESGVLGLELGVLSRELGELRALVAGLHMIVRSRQTPSVDPLCREIDHIDFLGG